ncbi:STAS domain-containing protein [Planomonospora sp. ID82291]|uniref:STAS domain-containing protein n=1 Tax=Planomonospora sp. ID82291 TaxID=2738136 RepID=UPI0018C44D49|nr:STAS domain-containing protein [Planomonospora sp. ID82291]MBG0816680.1 STAS domain-containing protein [Planomonospora sp. ID82291]
MLFEPDRGSAFTVSSEPRGEAIVVRARGELDYRSAPALHEHLGRLWAAPGMAVLVVDLSGVAFCDSVGLSELVDALQRSEAAGVRLMLSGVHGVLSRVLAITGLRKAFEIHHEPGDALRTAADRSADRSAGPADGDPCPTP